ncbi:hypothetical protein [Thiobacillus denitrificans]|uniref:hypothetical protein n=1 Tax=Thiobacillus denitrificans TaxID=36861 RepID=UPI0003797795|nr:hypothetical protein [Thiobacillus denitrificans]
MAEKNAKNLVEVSSLQDLVFLVKEFEVVRNRRGREFFRLNESGAVEPIGRITVNERDELVMMGASKKVFSTEKEIMRSELGQALKRQEVVVADLFDYQMIH